MSDLKPCPFCGSSDVGGASGIISCYRCPAEISVQNTNTHYAAELWNNRADRAQGVEAEQPVMEYHNSPSGMHVVWETLPYGEHFLYTLPSAELTAARDEAERLRARVAELEDSGSQVIRHIDSDMITDSECESCQRAFHGLSRAVQSGQDSVSWLLRKQADAIEASAKEARKDPASSQNAWGRGWIDGRESAVRMLEDYAQRLRQSADEAENV